MTTQNAVKIVNALARQEPEYDTLAAEYKALIESNGGLSGEIPAELPEAVLELVRQDPEKAALIDEYNQNLSEAGSYAPMDLINPWFIISVLILLRSYTKLEFKGRKLSFLTEQKPLNLEALEKIKPLLSVVLGKAAKGLAALSEDLSDEKKD